MGSASLGRRRRCATVLAALGVSPMPVREAVQRLAAEGALGTLPNRRVRVLIVTKARFRELLEIRMSVEGLATEKACRKILDDDIDRIEKLNRHFALEMAKTRPDPARLFRLNKDLHYILYEAAGAPDLLSIIEGLWIKIGPAAAAQPADAGQHARSEPGAGLSRAVDPGPAAPRSPGGPERDRG